MRLCAIDNLGISPSECEVKSMANAAVLQEGGVSTNCPLVPWFERITSYLSSMDTSLRKQVQDRERRGGGQEEEGEDEEGLEEEKKKGEEEGKWSGEEEEEEGGTGERGGR